ncbi:MAG: hypothetical protein COA78_03520 [Blastopirellula sp.]|nr:MAG: hypothetical protein COA78_03520 [Blastopirellula sp.]
MSLTSVVDLNTLLAFCACDSFDRLTHQAVQHRIDYENDLQTITKWSEINDGHHNEKRLGNRYQYRGTFTLAFLSTQFSEDTNCPELIRIEAFGIDLSTKGARFLCPNEFMPMDNDDLTEIIKLDHNLSISDNIVLGILQPDSSWILMQSEIRRIRKTRNQLNDFGVKLLGRQ